MANRSTLRDAAAQVVEDDPASDSTAVEVAQRSTGLDRLQDSLEKRGENIGALLHGTGIDPRRFIASLAAVATTPSGGWLLDPDATDQRSVIAAAYSIAAMGLSPVPTLGQVYMIPFKSKGINQAQVVIGYQGYRTLAMRSGTVKAFGAGTVMPGDVFDIEYGLDERLVHRPDLDADHPDGTEPTHVYAWVSLMTGGGLVTAEHYARALRLGRAASQGYQQALKFNRTKTHPWHAHPDAMARKRQVRALRHKLFLDDATPEGRRFATAFQLDERVARPGVGEPAVRNGELILEHYAAEEELVDTDGWDARPVGRPLGSMSDAEVIAEIVQLGDRMSPELQGEVDRLLASRGCDPTGYPACLKSMPGDELRVVLDAVREMAQ